MKLSERIRYIEAMVGQERRQATREAKRQCELVLSDAAERGAVQSGSTVVLRMRVRIEAAERLLRRRITIEEEVLSRERETAPLEWPQNLAEDIHHLLAEIRQDLERELKHDVGGILQAQDPSPFVRQSLDPEMDRLKDYYLGEVEVLRGKFMLDAEARAREAKAAMGRVTVNIHHGTVGTLNLGTVIGNIQTKLSILKADGHDQVVEALKRLTEEIGDAEELGDARREALQQVAVVTEEADRPPADRRPGVVRPILEALRSTMATSANLIKVWEFAWPHIKAHFNLE